MQYPKSMQIGANTISVFTHNKPLSVSTEQYEDENTGKVVTKTTTKTCEYSPLDNRIDIYVLPNNDSFGGVNFVHETIEAIDDKYDLKLNHTQITTLAEALYQAYKSGAVSFN